MNAEDSIGQSIGLLWWLERMSRVTQTRRNSIQDEDSQINDSIPYEFVYVWYRLDLSLTIIVRILSQLKIEISLQEVSRIREDPQPLLLYSSWYAWWQQCSLLATKISGSRNSCIQMKMVIQRSKQYVAIDSRLAIKQRILLC